MFDDSSENDEEMSNNYFNGGGGQENDSDSDDYDFFKIEKGVYGSKMIEFSKHILGPIRAGPTLSSPSILCKKFISLSCDNEIKWVETLKNLSKMPKGICAGPINRNDQSFKCYDCGNENEFHIFCSSCFYDGDHKDHRVQ
jgi:hypothetical protein